MRRRVLVATVVAALAGCDGRPAGPGPSHGMVEDPLAPARVKPFALGRPDLVLLVTGGTNGMMEVCNCAGPMPGGLARRSGLVQSYRAACDNVFLLDVGDVFWVEPEDIRNRYALKGYTQIGYDAVVMGDQEWASKLLVGFMPPAGGGTWLSTNVRASGVRLRLRVVDKITQTFGRVKLAVLSYVSPESFRFAPEETMDRVTLAGQADLRARTAELRRAGYVVVVVAHVEAEQVQQIAARSGADLVIRGHTTRCGDKLTRAGKVPVAKIGGYPYVGVLAMKIAETGRVAAIEYRVEIVSEHWPMDKRLIQTYQAYAHVAMRKALDRDRKTGLDYVPSATCGKCHKKQYAAWSAGPHARAYKTLQRVKRTGDPNCVTCHTSGFGTEKGFLTLAETPTLAGVNCQNCHRFDITADHKRDHFKQMRPRVSAEVCTTCHTPITDPKDNFAAALKATRGYRHQ